MPIGRLVTEESSLAVTNAAAPPGTNVPLEGERFSQAAVLVWRQVKEFVPELVSVRVIELGENGPPTGPLLVNPLTGVIRRSSGRSNASCTPVVVELPGALALRPMPRFANAVHKAMRLAPPLSTRSAWR